MYMLRLLSFHTYGTDLTYTGKRCKRKGSMFLQIRPVRTVTNSYCYLTRVNISNVGSGYNNGFKMKSYKN
jgi:hypothetical protein